MILQGTLINIEFEKAFDSLNWNFLIAVLEKIYFGPSFIKWIEIYHTKRRSFVTLSFHNGNGSNGV